MLKTVFKLLDSSEIRMYRNDWGNRSFFLVNKVIA